MFIAFHTHTPKHTHTATVGYQPTTYQSEALYGAAARTKPVDEIAFISVYRFNENTFSFELRESGMITLTVTLDEMISV